MPNCFVIMPFRPELKFFYRAIKSHIEQTFPDVTVERGDDRVLTTPILEKIADFIRQADVVIADCSDRNPNVFYELGMAHALGKPVVLITSDAVEEAPTDIRAFEFISYAQLSDDVFLNKLDDALQGVVGNPFAALYPEALALFQQFCTETHKQLAPSTQAEFRDAVRAMQSQGQPLPKERRRRSEFLIRRLLGAEPEIQVLTELKEWLNVAFP